MGAYTQGVLISACNILVTYGCAETYILDLGFIFLLIPVLYL